jgi:hypothetical protein
MGERYIVVEEKDHREFPVFIVYKKGLLFNSYVKLFLKKEEAINFVLSILRENDSYSRVVFDTKKDLKTDRIF